MALSVTVEAQIRATKTAAADVPAVRSDYNFSKLLSLADGTGAGKANCMWSDTRTIAASSSENLDLAGSLVDEFGATLTFTKVKAILVVAATGNTNNVEVGGAASNGFSGPFKDATDIVKLGPDGVFLWTNPAGATVTASTGDILKVANSGAGSAVTYTIVIIGEQ